MEDLWMEVNSNNEKIGFRNKKNFLDGKYIHRSVHLILINYKGEMLLQKRALSKKLYPDRFTFSVSGAVEDESWNEAIVRESLEEVGVEFEMEELFEFYSEDVGVDRAFRKIYLAEFNDEEIVSDDREISNLVWVDLNELKADLFENKKNYTPAFYEGMKIFFDNFVK